MRVKYRLLLLLLVLVPGCSDRTNPPPGEGTAASTPNPWFQDVAKRTGLDFHHFTGSTGRYYMHEIMGPGGALLDYDQDGDLDIFLLQGRMLDHADPQKSEFPPLKNQPLHHRLFRNELAPSGQLRFTDVTQSAGLAISTYGMGAATGDYDNDGYPDLFLTSYGRNYLLHNNGNGTFTDRTQPGMEDERWSTSAAFADYDRDGDLDLFFTNYVAFSPENNKKCYSPAGLQDYCTPKAYQPLPDRLFRNEGNGRFTDVSAVSGLGAVRGPGLGVVCFDFDRDGWLDIYVANDGAANFLWKNLGNGKFKDVALENGVAYGYDGIEQAGMGVDAADFDNTGADALFVTNLTGENNNLYRQDGSGIFTDEVLSSGLAEPGYRMTGFGLRFFDFDHDTDLDLYIANGAVTILEAVQGSKYPFHQKNQLFRNDNGKYVDVNDLAGPALALSEVSRGIATGDIDNDGDLDILVTNNNGPAHLLLNEIANQTPAAIFTLKGTQSSRDALGARVTLFKDGKPLQSRRVQADGSYLSASSPRVHFGLNNSPTPDTIRVQWPNNQTETFPYQQAQDLQILEQGSGN